MNADEKSTIAAMLWCNFIQIRELRSLLHRVIEIQVQKNELPKVILSDTEQMDANLERTESMFRVACEELGLQIKNPPA